jgi:hypothetical protein
VLERDDVAKPCVVDRAVSGESPGALREIERLRDIEPVLDDGGRVREQDRGCTWIGSLELVRPLDHQYEAFVVCALLEADERPSSQRMCALLHVEIARDRLLQ